MQGNEFVVMLFLWTFVVSGVKGKTGETVTGVLHSRVELQACYGPNVTVEWAKYENSTKRLITSIMTKCSNTCQGMASNSKQCLILERLTKNDEGIYEKLVTVYNGTIQRYNTTLSVLFVSNITVSSSTESLTLKCETNGRFNHLQWFINDQKVSDSQKYNLTENNRTMEVSRLNSSDCGMYTCQVSNEHGISPAFTVNVSDNIYSVCVENSSGFSAITKGILYPVGFSLIALVVSCIILIYTYKYCVCGKRNTSTPSAEEPVYNEPKFLQEEPAAVTVDPLIVYQDFIKPKCLNQSEQSEDFAYSTIADAVETIQLPQIST